MDEFKVFKYINQSLELIKWRILLGQIYEEIKKFVKIF